MANMNSVNSDSFKVKRKRSANWDQLEKTLLRSCMSDFIAIIENKNTDTNTNKSKILAWQSVTQRFNELNGRERDISEIKQQWRTMKLDAKKNMSDVKALSNQTGGGPKPPSPTVETIEILNMIPQEFEMDQNIFDSDGIAAKGRTHINKKEIILTPMDVINNVDENTTPQSNNTNEYQIIRNSCRSKRKLPFDDENKSKFKGTEQRNNVLIKCITEEHDLKIKNIAEAHELAKEEHKLKIKCMTEAHNLLKEKTELEIQKLKLELSILQKHCRLSENK